MKSFTSVKVCFADGSPSSRGRGLKYDVRLYGQGFKRSPSSRGRGLKYHCLKIKRHGITSPSSRGRGLKYGRICSVRGGRVVALFTRAWIEIHSPSTMLSSSPVALFTRAWIEIVFTRHTKRQAWSPSSRGRGLKSFTSVKVCFADGRPLHEGVD